MIAAEGYGSVQTHPAILSLQDWPRKVLMGKGDATSNFLFCIFFVYSFRMGLHLGLRDLIFNQVFMGLDLHPKLRIL